MSPRPGPRRPLIAFRLDVAQIQAIDEIAETTDVTRSDVIRDAIAQYLERCVR